jgi:HEXXH motif-containing protein
MRTVTESDATDEPCSNDPRDVARSWLIPGTNPELLADAVRGHGENLDLEAVADLRVPGLAKAIDVIATALDSNRQFLGRVPGCGGIHLSANAIERSPRIQAELQALAAEASAVTGRSFSATLNATTVYFPRSGITVQADGPSDQAQISAGCGRVALSWCGERLEFEPTDSAAILEPEGCPSGLTVQRSTVLGGVRVECDSAVLDLGIPDFFEVAAPPSAADISGLERTVGLIERASPKTLAELSLVTRCVVPLAQPPGRAIHSSSARQLPGVVYAVFSDPFEATAMVCHEYHHLKLFLLQERLALLRHPYVSTPAPWRPDIRKAEGVLHGTYVFFGIATLFDQIFDTLKPTRRGYRRLAVWRVCVEAGIRQLSSVDAQPTEAGTALLEGMEQMNVAALDKLKASHPEDAAWARSAVQAHLAVVGTDRRQEPWFLLV